jgi:hypothetical protein
MVLSAPCGAYHTNGKQSASFYSGFHLGRRNWCGLGSIALHSMFSPET